MNLSYFLKHLFVPHESNNQKAKILHPNTLFLIVLGLVFFQLVLTFTGRSFPRILGYAANISPEEVIRFTNEQRASHGLAQLSANPTLSQAALAKGNDMLSKDYWAHFAPDGTTPWSFFLSFGYKYKYAGENLARDFSDAGSAVNAWMNSPSHKDNILNPNYSEIGIGVIEGNLNGIETTIIVQFFGTPLEGVTGNIAEAKAGSVASIADTSPSVSPKNTTKPEKTNTPVPTPTQSPPIAVVQTDTETGSSVVFVSPFSSTKGISLLILGLILMILSIDLIVVRRNKIVRVGGKNLAHIAFLGMILAVILILKSGQII